MLCDDFDVLDTVLSVFGPRIKDAHDRHTPYDASPNECSTSDVRNVAELAQAGKAIRPFDALRLAVGMKGITHKVSIT